MTIKPKNYLAIRFNAFRYNAFAEEFFADENWQFSGFETLIVASELFL
jgi:hypothetical protein